MRPSASTGFVNQLLVYTLCTLCLSGSIGLGTVWMRHQISLTANASRVLETRLAELDRHLAETSAAIETEQDTALLKNRNRDLALGLAPFALGQVVSVTANPGTYLTTKRNRALFSERSMTVHFNPGPAARDLDERAGLVAVDASARARFALGN